MLEIGVLHPVTHVIEAMGECDTLHNIYIYIYDKNRAHLLDTSVLTLSAIIERHKYLHINKTFIYQHISSTQTVSKAQTFTFTPTCTQTTLSLLTPANIP